MKSKSELNKQAQEFITEYNTSVVYGTSDGQFFLEKNRANLHGKTKDLTVYEFTKDGSEVETTESVVNAGTLPSPEYRAKDEKELKSNKAKVKKEASDDVNAKENDEDEAQKAKEAAIDILKSDSDLDALEYKVVLQMVKDLGIKTENKQQSTLLTALQSLRETLKSQDNG